MQHKTITKEKELMLEICMLMSILCDHPEYEIIEKSFLKLANYFKNKNESKN